MPKRSVKSVKEACRKLWGKVIMSFGRCERCGRVPGGGEITKLEPHHIYGRGISGRLYVDLRNGMALCHPCHRWAEGNPVDFTDWFRNYRISDAKYLAEEHAKGPMVGLEKKTLEDWLEIEKELKAELERVTY